MLPTHKALTEPWGRVGVWLKTTSLRENFPYSNQPLLSLKCCTQGKEMPEKTAEQGRREHLGEGANRER